MRTVMQKCFAYHRYLLLSVLVMVCWLVPSTAVAQGTAFTYQGKLSDNSNPASGPYDFQFKLFDTQTVGTGTQQGTTVLVSNVTVTAGIFTVQLDFGACANCFNGAPRFLEIAVKPTSGSTFTTLGPRQPISSNPYAIRSLNSTAADGLSVACVNCVTSSQIQSVQGSQVSGAIPVASVPVGSANYIQNGNSQQATSNFNISGTGTAGVFDAATQYNFAGQRVLGVTGSASFPNSNLFLGPGAGQINAPNGSNGIRNTFAGNNAGAGNTTGTANSFFGALAGEANVSGGQNSFFGRAAGQLHQSGSDNSFFGSQAGQNNVTGSGNTYVGAASGGSDALTNSTALGFRAFATQSNTLVLGSISGANGATADTNVGIGTTSPAARLHVVGDGLVTGNLTVNGTMNANLSSNIVNAMTQYNLGGRRVLSVSGTWDTDVGTNSYVGVNAGLNTTPDPNPTSLVGKFNSFFGLEAGSTNTTGNFNSFFGYYAGQSNVTGIANSFFGSTAGTSTTGMHNTFVGQAAGFVNTTGSRNVMIGSGTGFSNTEGSNNTLIGAAANMGANNLTNAAAIGNRAFVSQNNSLVLGSINGINSCTAANNCDSVNVGIGTTSPAAPLHIQRNGNIGADWQNAQLRISGASDANMQLNLGFDTTNNRGVIQAGQANVAFKDLLLNPSGGNLGIGISSPESLLHLRGASPLRILADIATLSGTEYVDFMARNSGFASDLGGLRIQRQATTGNIDTLIFASPNGSAASEKMRITGTGNVGIGVNTPTFQLQLSSDSAAKPNGGSWSNPSDSRLKENIRPFTDGLDILLKINPVSYRLNGKAGMPKGEPGIGIIAQEVRDLLPYTITTFKAKLEAGDAKPTELFAFNSSALTFVLINAVKELSSRLDALELSSKQAEIEALKRENEGQRHRLADLDARLAAMEQLIKKLNEKP
jgi:trimeric autotransporter adhesin